MRKLCITAIFICITAVSFGQFNLGAKIGVNFSKLSTNVDELKTSMKPGFDIGLFGRVGFGQKWYLQPEVLYSFQSTEFDDMAGTVKGKTHNIVVPVLVGYKVFNAKLVNVRVFAGPDFSFVVGKDYPNLIDPSTVNVAIDLGAGVDIAMITIDLKYGIALNKSATTPTQIINDWNPHNNLFSLSVGWKFL